MLTQWPVDGQAASVFSADRLSCNETTRDWHTHKSIELTAPAGTPVKAAADGEVYTVYEDQSPGTTVVLRHRNDYVTSYGSLTSELAVKAGESVSAGDTLETVGSTALTEKALGNHVHFAVSCKGKSIDPEKFINQ